MWLDVVMKWTTVIINDENKNHFSAFIAENDSVPLLMTKIDSLNLIHAHGH